MERKEVKHDELNNMLFGMVDVVLKSVPLSDLEQDELWELLQMPLEKFFDYPDYRNYN